MKNSVNLFSQINQDVVSDPAEVMSTWIQSLA